MDEDLSRNFRDLRPVEGELERRFGLGQILERVLAVSAPPVRCGRYLLEEKLGEGGMGTVYRAFDPELDRHVALKLLHEGGGTGADRLRQESRALARLAHPNVVGVFDVGSDDDHTWLAMELAPGCSLAQWAEDHPPTDRARRKQALSLLIGAGRGLAAAHRAGIVHRDFKPENVLVSPDGVARVVDFGLARPRFRLEGPSSEPSLEASMQSSAPAASDSDTTAVTAVAGTPMYMAPEQFEGEAPSFSSDQYAFCLSAWQVLFGKLPFRPDEHVRRLLLGESSALRHESVFAGDRRIVRALKRGLDPDPRRRFPSMETLLEALSSTRRRRRRLVLGVGVLGLGAAIAAATTPSRQGCRPAQFRIELETVWNHGRRAIISEAATASSLPYAAASWQAIEETLDGFFDEWMEARLEFCERVRTGDAIGVDAGIQCLRRSVAQIDALAARLEQADPRALELGYQVVVDIMRPAECLTPTAAQNEDLGLDRDLEETLAEARTALELGDYERTETLSQALLAALDQREQSRARGDALSVMSAARAMSGHPDWKDPAIEAFWTAKRAGDDDRVVQRAARLAISSSNEGALEEANRWLRHARAQFERGSSSTEWTAELNWIECNVEQAQGHSELAMAACDRALEGVDEKDESDARRAPRRTRYRNSKAVVLQSIGRYREAYEILDDELKRALEQMHPMHPFIAALTANLGGAAVSAGEHEHALVLMERAVLLERHTHGSEHMNVARALVNVATVAQIAEQPTRARDAIAEAIRIHEALDVAVEVPTLTTLARIQRELGELDDAHANVSRALAIEASTLRPDHPSRAITHGAMVEVLIRRGEFEKAREHAMEALRVARSSDNEHAESWTLLQLARILEGEGKPLEAIEAYEVAASFCEHRPERRDDHDLALEALKRLRVPR
jgi:eukaryotic-like serine/threonine-protein kinase